MCAMKFVLYTGKVSKHYALKVITSEIFFLSGTFIAERFFHLQKY